MPRILMRANVSISGVTCGMKISLKYKVDLFPGSHGEYHSRLLKGCKGGNIKIQEYKNIKIKNEKKITDVLKRYTL